MGKSSSEDALGGNSVKLDFGLYTSGLGEDARKAWPFDFGLVYSVTLAKDSLQTVVNVRNEGEESFEFQFLLHTYLKIKVSFPSILYIIYSLTRYSAGYHQGLRQRSSWRRVRRQGP